MKELLGTPHGKDGAIGLFGVAAAVGSSWVSTAEGWLAFGSALFGCLAGALTVALLAIRLWRAVKGKDKKH